MREARLLFWASQTATLRCPLATHGCLYAGFKWRGFAYYVQYLSQVRNFSSWHRIQSVWFAEIQLKSLRNFSSWHRLQSAWFAEIQIKFPPLFGAF